MIKEITQEIISRTGWVLGTRVHFGTRPQDAADRCALVAFNGGGAAEFDLPDRRDVMVQILTRSGDYQQAYDDAVAAYVALHGLAGVKLAVLVSGEAWEALVIEAVAAPQYIGEDAKRRHEWSTNYIWKVKDASK